MKISAQPQALPAKWGLIKLAFLSVLIVFSFLFFSNGSAQASGKVWDEEPTTSQSSTSKPSIFNTDGDVPENFHSVVQVVMLETLSAAICQLAGTDPMSEGGKCLGVNPTTGKIGFVESGGGAIAAVGKLIDYTFIPPATSTQYFAYMKSNFGITKSAYAQTTQSPCSGINDNGTRNGIDISRGVGFCGLEPLLPLWVAMRNIVYLILILVFVIIGLGIMLRVHIDPRTVMTIQNQIPKIVVGILAITFSFAIAGFLIDVMWVAIYLFAGVITSATGTGGNPNFLTNMVTSGTPFDAANNAFIDVPGDLFPNGPLAIAETTSKAFAALISDALRFGDWQIIGQLLGGIVNLLAFIVILIAIIIVLLRLWVVLIFTYINIILDVIFAPFWILAGLLPGSSMGVGAWIRDLIANLAVFPVAIGFFLLANYIVRIFALSGTELANRFNPPLLGGTNSAAVAALIGLGFILMLPNLLTTMKAALKAPKLNLGPIMGPLQAGMGGVASTPKRYWSFQERYKYNQAAGVQGWRAFVTNPLLAKPHAGTLKPSHGAPPSGGKAEH